MSGWHHRHILDLAAFSREDYAAVLELAPSLSIAAGHRCASPAGPSGTPRGHLVLRTEHADPQQL